MAKQSKCGMKSYKYGKAVWDFVVVLVSLLPCIITIIKRQPELEPEVHVVKTEDPQTRHCHNWSWSIFGPSGQTPGL
jgi:hypothetical protein